MPPTTGGNKRNKALTRPTGPGTGKFVPSKQGNVFSRITTNLSRAAASAMPKDYYQQFLQTNNPQTPGENTNPAGIDTSSGRSRGGGGGAPAGPTPEQVRQWAAELYSFDASPYNQMRTDIEAQRNQANAYNPDFATMQAGYDQRLMANEADRANMVKQRLANLVGVGQQLAGQQGQAMQGALRDLTAQGFNASPYLQQANQIGGERTQALANQTGYQGQMDVNAAQQTTDFRNAGNLTRLGGETSLANNRGTLLNTLQQNLSNVGLQQSQAQRANDQARREFLIKYGVT